MQVNARMVLDGLDEVDVDMLDEAIDVEGAGLDVPHVRADGQRRKIGRVAKRERRERIDLARNDDIGAAAIIENDTRRASIHTLAQQAARVIEARAIGIDSHVGERGRAVEVASACRGERKLAQMLEVRGKVHALERRIEKRLVANQAQGLGKTNLAQAATTAKGAVANLGEALG